MAVDLIAEDIGVRAAGNLDDLLQQLPGHQCPGGIVGIVDADHLRVRRHQCTKLVQIGQIAVFLPQIHDGHIGADGCRNRVKLLVGGHDAHYAVPGGDQGAENVVIGTGGAVGQHDLIGTERAVELADSLMQSGTAVNISIG